MKPISEQKTLLRKTLIAQRNSLSQKDWQRKSNAIKEHVLVSQEFKDANSIHCFISMNERFEVDTHVLIEEMLAKGKKVVVPLVNGKDGTLKHSELNSLSDLEANGWGVLEPKYIKPVDIALLDLILVPLLGADLKGNRLGYGKGFYDRFLEEVNAISFGLLFEEFILEKIPTESFDKKLNGLISEKGVIYT